MGIQLSLIDSPAEHPPTLTVFSDHEISPVAKENWVMSGLASTGLPVEEWVTDASNRALGYATHGLFRYFGKFPPTVARHLIAEFTQPGQSVLDPMIGSGTTAVEALLLDRGCHGIDVSPLSCLLSRVKTRRVAEAHVIAAVKRVLEEAGRTAESGRRGPEVWPSSINVGHFFLPETANWLCLLREAIADIEDESVREVLLVAFASIIRRVSRATSQQGRLFLDVATAEPDPRPRFEAAARHAAARVAALPESRHPLEMAVGNAMEQDYSGQEFPLIVCHPPYFNGYRYSRVFCLELGWLGYIPKTVTKDEVHEFFKLGKPEKVGHYVSDMSTVLRRLAPAVGPQGVLALMIGDTILRGERVQTTRMVLEEVQDSLQPFKIAVRTPRHTEASWVTSQRRKRGDVGIRILDYVVLLQRA